MTYRVALVTGAATGLGRAIAIRLSHAGATIRLVDRDAANVKHAATLMRDAGGQVLVQHRQRHHGRLMEEE